MRLLILNPNATAEMTESIGREARRHAPPGVEILLRTNHEGPASIQGAADGEAALPGTLRLMGQGGFDRAVIACFDDTGLPEWRAGGGTGVLGLGEAAFMAAAESGRDWAVLTTSRLSLPVLEGNLAAYGLGARCLALRASDIEVLEFEHNREQATRRLATAARALTDDLPQLHAIVLGCAGMGGLAETLEHDLGIRVIDPVAAAVNQGTAIFARTQT